MKKLFISLLFLLISLSVTFQKASAQKLKITWGKTHIEPPRSTLTKIIGSDDTGFYALRTSLKRFKAQPVLEKYDNNMDRVFSESLQPTIDKKVDLEFENIFLANDKLLLFSSYYNKDKNKNFGFVNNISKSGDVDPEFLNIGSIDADRKNNIGGYNFTFSGDSTRILVFNDEPYERKESEKFGFRVYDSDFNLQWEKKVTLPYNDEVFVVKKHSVDNNGNVYISGKLFEGKVVSKKQGKPNYKYIILAYSDKGETAKEYNVSLGEKFITSLTYKISDEGELICAGLYSEKGTSTVKGTFFIRIDGESKEVVASGTKDFETDFLEQFMSDNKAAKGKELYNYNLSDFILRDDGGAVLIAEQFYIITRTVTTTNSSGIVSTRTIFTYYYRDLLAININPDATIAWATKIPKKQITSNDGGYYSSYALAIVKDKIYIIYNDDPKNLTINETDKVYTMKNPKRSVTTVAVIDVDGNYTKKPLFSSKEQGTITRPKICRQTSKNEMVIFGEKRKDIAYGKIEFN